MGPIKMSAVIDGKKYNTETATLLAGNDFWDGSNFERGGRNLFLYRTPNGRFFTLGLSQWQGERDEIKPVSREEAKELFEDLDEKRVDWETAFDEKPEEA